MIDILIEIDVLGGVALVVQPVDEVVSQIQEVAVRLFRVQVPQQDVHVLVARLFEDL